MNDYQENRRGFLQTAKTAILQILGGVAMFLLFIVAAFLAMRLAIHGREVTIPNLAGMSDAQAAEASSKLGLHLSVENRFYALVPVNHVLSQSPIPGSRVRRGWQIRVTESLGTQQVPVPDVIGEGQQPATLMLRRLQLDVGLVAHLPGPAPAGVVLAQSPPPNVAGVDGPRIALLVADESNLPSATGYVMPSIIGLSFAAARSRLATVGLHLVVPESPEEVAPPSISPLATGSGSAPAASVPLLQAPLPLDPALPAMVVSPVRRLTGVIVSQSPQPGRRVTRADTIHVTLSN